MTAKNTAHVFIRCTPEQKKAWQRKADQNGRSLNNWVKRVLDAEGRRPGATLQECDTV